jgi:hypothetical protein
MLNSWWIRLAGNFLPFFYNVLGQALGRLRCRLSPDGQVSPAGADPLRMLPSYELLWNSILMTHSLTGAVLPLDLRQVMVHRFPEPRSSSAWRDVFRAWRVEERNIWRQDVLDTVISDLESSTASDGMVPVVEAINRGLQVACRGLQVACLPEQVQATELPVEMDVD